MYLIEYENENEYEKKLAEERKAYVAEQKAYVAEQKAHVVQRKALVVAEREALLAERKAQRKAYQKALSEISKKDAELAELKRRFGVS